MVPLILWLVSIALTLITWAILWGIGTHVITYPASGLGHLSTSVLTVIGVLVGILFAVFTTVNRQTREDHYRGFDVLRKAVEELQNLNVRLKSRSLELADRMTTANPPQHDILERRLDATRFWVEDLTRLLDRVNRITINWSGWEQDRTLENELVNYTSFAQSISKCIGDDAYELLTIFERGMRNILIGLRQLDEAILGDVLLLRLSWIIGSLITLTGFGLAFRVAADLNIGLVYTSNHILFASIFLSFSALTHLSALVVFVSRWWDEVRNRDASWAS